MMKTAGYCIFTESHYIHTFNTEALCSISSNFLLYGISFTNYVISSILKKWCAAVLEGEKKTARKGNKKWVNSMVFVLGAMLGNKRGGMWNIRRHPAS